VNLIASLLEALAEWIDDAIAGGQPPKWVAYNAAKAARLIADLAKNESTENSEGN